MPPQQPAQLATFACGEQVNHLQMIIDVARPPGGGGVQQIACPQDPCIQHPVLIAQDGVVSNFKQPFVDTLVEAKVIRQFALFVTAGHRRRQSTQIPDISSGCIAGCQFPGQRLKRTHDLKGIANFIRPEIGDGSTPVGLQLNQPLIRKYFQRLPQRGPGNSEIGTELALRYPFTGR